jgi:hypothetical protein
VRSAFVAAVWVAVAAAAAVQCLADGALRDPEHDLFRAPVPDGAVGIVEPELVQAGRLAAEEAGRGVGAL